MIRHRIVARGVTGEGWTVALVRFKTDEQAKAMVNSHQAKSIYKDTLTVVVYREEFNLQGMTISRKDLTTP